MNRINSGSRFRNEFNAVVACADLAGRTGAKSFNIGYLDDEAPYKWYAEALYKGARLFSDEYNNPNDAADALARRLLEGGTCTNCKRETSATNASKRYCYWYRIDSAWIRSCDGKSKATRKKQT